MWTESQKTQVENEIAYGTNFYAASEILNTYGRKRLRELTPLQGRGREKFWTTNTTTDVPNVPTMFTEI